jgi:hypothetical protein
VAHDDGACDFHGLVIALVREGHEIPDVFCGYDASSFYLSVDVCKCFCDKAKLLRRKGMLLCREAMFVCHKANFVCDEVNFVCHEADFVCHKANFVCHEANFVCREAMLLRDSKTCVRRKPNLA